MKEKKHRNQSQLLRGASRTEKERGSKGSNPSADRHLAPDLFLFHSVCFCFQFESNLLQILTSFFNFLGPQV